MITVNGPYPKGGGVLVEGYAWKDARRVDGAVVVESELGRLSQCAGSLCTWRAGRLNRRMKSY